ncbi:phage major tail protein, TP901-1 family [Streptococcus danieliae]|uniref:Phage major tail protein, TP901-1 family n=1 Tax=Streptococcus danieliae TaxID=747656 RepID=A0A7Z0M7F4_9STRE|nr:phage major tail protein, TP901-1 family [Streptococcus danieliae]MBF0699679.1 phage major tail protein, TP901-1 family [Streptococcus danieliae]NYS96855.1 phage major tail protein, TP901-1 family [Streptococcus danieliae]
MAKKGEQQPNISITTGKPIIGSKVFYFIQAVDAALGSAALLPSYRTDGTTTLGGEYLDEQTQQGRLLEKSTDEHSIEVTSYHAPQDPSVGVIEDASRSGKSVKVWEVIVDDSVKLVQDNKDTYPAKFGYAKVGEVERSSGTTDYVELSYTLDVIGALKDGRFPLTQEEIALLTDVYEYQNPGETTGDYNDIQKAGNQTETVSG